MTISNVIKNLAVKGNKMREIRFQTNQTVLLKNVSLKDEMQSEKKLLKPRILMVGTHLTKTRGGITTLITELLNSELQNDFQIRYIASQAEDFGGFRKGILALSAMLKFAVEIFRRPPTLVYIHIGSNASLYRESLFIILAKVFNRKVIGHFHAGDIDEYFSVQSNVGQMFISKSLSLCDRLIAVADESARKLKKLAPESEIEVVVNSIKTDDFNFLPHRFDQRKNLVRILFVGAMGKLKGEKDLADALKILRDKFSNLRVSFLGYGSEDLLEYCREIGVEDLIEFCGAVSLEKRIEFYENADIFVLPTLAEAMPISVIEAMASGLAIVSTKVGGIPEIIENGKEGFLVEPQNFEQLAEKIELLANDKKLRLKIASAARLKAQNTLSFEVFIEKIKTQINRTLKKKNV